MGKSNGFLARTDNSRCKLIRNHRASASGDCPNGCSSMVTEEKQMTTIKNWIYDNEMIIIVYGLIAVAAICAAALGASTADIWSNGHINFSF